MKNKLPYELYSIRTDIVYKFQYCGCIATYYGRIKCYPSGFEDFLYQPVTAMI